MSGELRADPGIAPGQRNIQARPRRSIWPSIAVVSAAAAFGGVIWFAYQNARDASRSGPPLVEAEAGPTKIRPDNPGGQQVPFQDSTVYDRLGPKGQKPAVEKLLPPPETPVERVQATPPSDAVSSQPPVGPIPSAAASLPPADPDSTSPTALAPAPGAIITQPPPERPVAAPARQASAPPVSPQAPRPLTIADLEKKALEAPTSKPAAAGAYRIQISAVRSQDAVAPEWERLKRRFPETLAALTVSSSKAEVAGKGAFYRLRAGPLDQASAKSACDHLRAQGLGCVVVKP